MSETVNRPPLQPAPFIWTGTPLAQARSLPGHCYTAPEFFQAEMAHIHRRTWFIVGRVDELPDPGDYRAIDTVGGPVMVLRDRDGGLRAFANFCRHRGSVLLEGCGSVRSILCPYHAWTYRLDGSLAGAPAMDKTDGFDKADYGLIPVRLEIWAGFIFLNFSETAPSLIEDLGNLPDLLASHRPDEMVCTWRMDFDAACNWKLLVENATESYHTGSIHRATVGAQTSVSIPAVGQWLGMQVLSSSSIGVFDGAPPLPEIDGLDHQARQGTYFAIVHPTTQFAASQDCLWWLTTRPVAPDRTILSIGGCFPRSTTRLATFEADARPYYDRWEKVAREDMGILERMQRALGSVHYRPGPLSWRDDLVHGFDQWVLARVPAAVR